MNTKHANTKNANIKHMNTKHANTKPTNASIMTREALASLGGGRIAYVKTMKSEDVQKQFPQVPQLAPGTLLYALHAADGTPIMLTDSRESAVANAWSHELVTMSVH
jgi:hypothetical protein